ncbi:hypothetical protein [Klebsiella aerogenes]|uniref:hypothetical protein n=1 Tax=Klebsiella aerogenes TaxID=548 RepID=UPI0034D21DF9
MTTCINLPRCPTCNMQPEFHWKNYTFGACSGALKCPNNHYRVQHGYWAGSQVRAKKELIKKWRDVVAGEKTV